MEDQSLLGASSHVARQLLKIGNASVVEMNDFAIEPCALDAQLANRFDQTRQPLALFDTAACMGERRLPPASPETADAVLENTHLVDSRRRIEVGGVEEVGASLPFCARGALELGKRDDTSRGRLVAGRSQARACSSAPRNCPSGERPTVCRRSHARQPPALGLDGITSFAASR